MYVRKRGTFVEGVNFDQADDNNFRNSLFIGTASYYKCEITFVILEQEGEGNFDKRNISFSKI